MPGQLVDAQAIGNALSCQTSGRLTYEARQDCIRFDDRGHFFQCLFTELLIDLGQCSTLRITELNPPLDLVASYTIFGHQILHPQEEGFLHRPYEVNE